MSIYITGDTHGTFDLRKVVYFFNGREDEFSWDDYLMFCGDVGVCGFMASDEAKTRDILRNLPVTVLFVDGNHENFEQLNSYAVEIWNGGKVHFIESNIIHLMRGQVFEIDGKKFFTFGGAYSVDKMYRTEGITWFPEEIPSKEEYEEGWKNLEKAVQASSIECFTDLELTSLIQKYSGCLGRYSLFSHTLNDFPLINLSPAS